MSNLTYQYDTCLNDLPSELPETMTRQQVRALLLANGADDGDYMEFLGELGDLPVYETKLVSQFLGIK